MGASASTHAASHTGILSELAGFSEVVESRFLVTVSYTHLTLPTILLV